MGAHYRNTLLLKIKFSFVFTCIFMTSALYTCVYFLSSCKWSWIPVCNIVLLKAYLHYFTYRKIKYKDDGRDFVSISEYVTIHVGFSVLYSWCTYMMFYVLFIYYEHMFGDPENGCIDGSLNDHNKAHQEFYYSW